MGHGGVMKQMKTFLNKDVARQNDVAFSILREHLQATQGRQHLDLREVCVHHWVMTLGTLLNQAGLAICVLANVGHGKAAMAMTRAATEYTVKIPYFMENPDRAATLMIVEPMERVHAKHHMGDKFKLEHQKQLDADLILARVEYRKMHPSLEKATDKQVDKAMDDERFPNMAALVAKYLGHSMEYVVRYMFQSGIEHGSYMGVREALNEVKAGGAVEVDFTLSNGNENNIVLMVASYAILVCHYLTNFYDIQKHEEYDALVARHLELKNIYDPD